VADAKIRSTTRARIIMEHYPKIKKVTALEGKRLKVVFEGDIIKIYDCTPLLNEDAFKPLQNDAFFENVHTDNAGYGVAWNDDIDLSESELWIHGQNI